MDILLLLIRWLLRLLALALALVIAYYVREDYKAGLRMHKLAQLALALALVGILLSFSAGP